MSFVDLQLAWVGLQAQDTDRQTEHDVVALFDRAVRKEYSWFAGSEAGGAATNAPELLEREAEKAGFRVARPRGQDCWIAVDKDFIGGGWDPYFEEIIKADGKAPRRHTAKGVCAVSFECPPLRRVVTVIAAHYLTRGRPDAKPEYSINLEENQRLAHAIGDYARLKGRGRDIVFYHGDQNIVDQKHDTFFGEPLTSSWDELKKWEGTGHGNIDVIASLDHDKRVSARMVRSVRDRQFHLHTDHFLVEAEFRVKVGRVR